MVKEVKPNKRCGSTAGSSSRGRQDQRLHRDRNARPKSTRGARLLSENAATSSSGPRHDIRRFSRHEINARRLHTASELAKAVVDWARANEFREDIISGSLLLRRGGGFRGFRPARSRPAVDRGRPRKHDEAVRDGIHVCVSRGGDQRRHRAASRQIRRELPEQTASPRRGDGNGYDERRAAHDAGQSRRGAGATLMLVARRRVTRRQ